MATTSGEVSMFMEQADFVHVINPGNLQANPPISDFQFTFGVSYSL
ncbi:MAG: hypothetical protein ACOXZ2_05860 [Sphaerochaetaceae bacterium]